MTNKITKGTSPADHPGFTWQSRTPAKDLTPGLYVFRDGWGSFSPQKIKAITPEAPETYTLPSTGKTVTIQRLNIEFEDGEGVAWLEGKGCSVLEPKETESKQ